jgi:DNA-binding NarL/FixJ family response regulator
MPDSVRRTLQAALREYSGSGKRAALIWVDLEPLEKISPRELDVVRLVAQGMSNKKVAAELVIDPKTVRSHLANVSAKLGTSNRTEVALWFWRQTSLVTDDDDEGLEPEQAVSL